MAQDAGKNKQGVASQVFKAIGNGFKDIGVTFTEGDWKTKISYLVFGFGPIMRGQILIGVSLLALEVLFFWFMAQRMNRYQWRVRLRLKNPI